MKKRKDFFENFLQGLDTKLAAQLRLDQQRQKMREEFVRRQELEKLKNEITEEVLARISVSADITDAVLKIKELKKELKNLTK